MRIFTAAVAALLARLSVAFAEGDDDSVHSLAIPVSHSGTYLVAPTRPVPVSLSTVSEPAKAVGLATMAKLQTATSEEVILRRSGDKLLCDCGPGKSNTVSKCFPSADAFRLLLFEVWREGQMRGAGRWYLPITFQPGCRVRFKRNGGSRHNPNDDLDIAHGES